MILVSNKKPENLEQVENKIPKIYCQSYHRKQQKLDKNFYFQSFINKKYIKKIKNNIKIL